MFLEFDCGCKIKMLDENKKHYDNLPSLKIDFENLNYYCEDTWRTFHEGRTKGVFQLETHLGKAWSKRVLPDNIEELAAVISIIRPGVLKAKLEDKSMTQHFADRKLGVEQAVPMHPSIEDILSPTQQILIYQESTLKIAQKIAGFSLQEADILRKAIGKKQADLMTEVENKFLEGCKKVGLVTEEEAREIWSNIRKSERYSFNKSHAVEYAILGYWSAYVKTHFPIHFYTAWLNFAKEKIKPEKEVKDLVSDAKTNDIDVCVPSLLNFNDALDFHIFNKKIYFGPRNIKRVGESQVKKLNTEIATTCAKIKKTLDNWTWYDFLIYFSKNVSKTVVNNLILVGALDHYKLSRKSMLHEYSIWESLTEKEQNLIIENASEISGSTLRMALIWLANSKKPNRNRLEMIKSLVILLENPPSSLEDTATWINKTEQELLGVAITSQKLDSCSTVEADTTCKEFLDGKNGEMFLCVEIKEVKEITIKRGKNTGKKMAFLVIEDHTGIIDNVVAFSEVWEENISLLYPENTVAISAYKSKENSLVINKVRQL